MMVVLEQREYIKLREDSDAYVLTLKMFALSHRFPPISRLSAAAVPVMKQLAHDTKQSCHVVIHYDGRGHVVGQQDAPTERILSVRLGAEAPLLDTCSGHVLLPSPTTLSGNACWRRSPIRSASRAPGEIAKLVKRVRKRGHEIIKSAQVQGVQDIGYPVLDRSGNIVAGARHTLRRVSRRFAPGYARGRVGPGSRTRRGAISSGLGSSSLDDLTAFRPSLVSRLRGSAPAPFHSRKGLSNTHMQKSCICDFPVLYLTSTKVSSQCLVCGIGGCHDTQNRSDRTFSSCTRPLVACSSLTAVAEVARKMTIKSRRSSSLVSVPVCRIR